MCNRGVFRNQSNIHDGILIALLVVHYFRKRNHHRSLSRSYKYTSLVFLLSILSVLLIVGSNTLKEEFWKVNILKNFASFNPAVYLFYSALRCSTWVIYMAVHTSFSVSMDNNDLTKQNTKRRRSGNALMENDLIRSVFISVMNPFNAALHANSISFIFLSPFGKTCLAVCYVNFT